MEVTVLGTPVALDGAFLDASPGRVRDALAAYEHGERLDLDIRVSYPDGFVGDVMRAMRAIPAGETRTYGDLAADLDTAAVAVGQACGRNPVPVVVPCHRVVGADSLGGFSMDCDDPVGTKRRLLEHEGALEATETTQTTLPV